MYYSTSYSTSGLESISSGTVIAALAVAIVSIIAQWKIFTKAGKPGWQQLFHSTICIHYLKLQE